MTGLSLVSDNYDELESWLRGRPAQAQRSADKLIAAKLLI